MTNNKGSNPPSAAARSSGVASSRHQGLHQPTNDEGVEDALGNVDLESRGERTEDHLLNRGGKGVTGAYDDSIDHNADAPAPPTPGRGPQEKEQKFAGKPISC